MRGLIANDDIGWVGCTVGIALGFDSEHATHLESVCLLFIIHVGQLQESSAAFGRFLRGLITNEDIGWVDCNEGFVGFDSETSAVCLLFIIDGLIANDVGNVVDSVNSATGFLVLSVVRLNGELNVNSFRLCPENDDCAVSSTTLGELKANPPLLVSFSFGWGLTVCIDSGFGVLSPNWLTVDLVSNKVLSRTLGIGVTLTDGENMVPVVFLVFEVLLKLNFGSAVIAKGTLTEVISGMVFTTSSSLLTLLEKCMALVFSLFILRVPEEIDDLVVMAATGLDIGGGSVSAVFGENEREFSTLVDCLLKRFIVSTLLEKVLPISTGLKLDKDLIGGAMLLLFFSTSFDCFLTISLNLLFVNTELEIFLESLTGEDILPRVFNIRFAVWLVTTFRFAADNGLAFILVLVVLNWLDTGESLILLLDDSRKDDAPPNVVPPR